MTLVPLWRAHIMALGWGLFGHVNEGGGASGDLEGFKWPRAGRLWVQRVTWARSSQRVHGARGQAIEGDRTKGWDHGISGSTRAMGGDKGAPISGSSDTHTQRESQCTGRTIAPTRWARHAEREREREGARARGKVCREWAEKPRGRGLRGTFPLFFYSKI